MKNYALVYAGLLHFTATVGLIVLVALGKIDTATGMALIGGLVGFAGGVPVTVTQQGPISK